MPSESENTVRIDSTGPPLAPDPYQSQASFIAAIRRGDPLALRKLFLFYAPLLRDQARKMSVPEDERDEMVTTLLDDVVLRLHEAQIPPRELTRYVVAALRNRARNHHRDRKRRLMRSERAYSEHGPAAQRIVAECHSAYGLQQSAPSDDSTDESLGASLGDTDALSLRSAIEKLAERSALALTAQEQDLMVGVSRHIPMRELAAQAGITYGAARVRVHRLRERMVTLAIQHVAALDGIERRELLRFFRRAGVSLKTDEQRLGGEQASSPRTRSSAAAPDDHHTEEDR